MEYKENYLLFPQDRKFPIKDIDVISQGRFNFQDISEFYGQAQPGEYFTFQIAVYALNTDVKNISVTYSVLKSNDENITSNCEFTCFNLGGIDCHGGTLTKRVSIDKGNFQVLWIGIDIPKNISRGNYESYITVHPENDAEKKIKLTLTISGNVLEDRGDGELWRHSRLRWLDSTIALDDEITAPYIPVSFNGNTITCLGRELSIDKTGLPSNIKSMFSRNVDTIDKKGRCLLSGPIALVIEKADGEELWSENRFKVVEHNNSLIKWCVESKGSKFNMSCQGTMEYDGYVSYAITVKPKENIDVRDIRLEIPFMKDAAKYFMGMGRQGGSIPDVFQWKWNRNLDQDCVWIGDVNAGLKCHLKASDYVKPFVNIYYKHKPINIPESWDNEGRGGCRIEYRDDSAIFTAYSGDRSMKAGCGLEFNFDLIITPVKPIDMKKHWNSRYYHNGDGSTIDSWIPEALEGGANFVNVHHGNDLHPYINYPFVEVKDLKALIDEAHSRGLKVKIYYTLREISNHIVELWAFRSLGDEIFPAPKFEANGIDFQGGKDRWLEENLGRSIIPAWKHVFNRGKHAGETDASIIVEGMSRLNNYYLEGLDWLVQNVEIDGIYVDDVGYDRTIMRRVRKILDTRRPGCLIDLHSWNHFENSYGTGWANCANLYMELFPYIDSIWFGEGFDYEGTAPDYWISEISGIPYGLMGEMLQDGGNPWRGMVYGMTNRLPWSGKSPTPIWKLWDEFGIQDAKMYGYWDSLSPVKMDCDDILATVYEKEGKALVAIASWAAQDLYCTLNIDYSKLGIDQDNAELFAPGINGLQDEKVISLNDKLFIECGKGLIFIISKRFS